MNEPKKPLSKAVVQAAAAGDPDAADEVLAYYSDYIDSLCVRTSRKRNGAVVHHIDEDMRSQIRRMFLQNLPDMKLDL